MSFADFHFLRPWWLLLLPVGILVVWQLWRALHQGEAWRFVCDPELLPHLLVGGKDKRHALPYVLLAIAWIVAVTALAGPTWERLDRPVFRSLNTQVIVLDLSRSMDAADIKPSRLTHAKFKIADILARSSDGQVALIAFAGDAFLVSPVTQDVNTVSNMLGALRTDVMPVQGSRTSRGLEMAGELLKRVGASNAQVLLIADGADDELAEHSAKSLQASGHTVSVLGVGSDDGAPIPVAGGGFLKDNDGNIVVSRADFAALRRLAAAGGGHFAKAGSNEIDLSQILAPPTTPSFQEVQDEHRTSENWRDEGPWLVLLLLPIAALAFRRGWLLSLLVLVTFIPQPSYAFSWDELWLRSDQRAARSLARGDPEHAARVTANPHWRGSALYRTQSYGAAAESFAQQDDATAHYNRGNALAKAGDLEQALNAYDRVLEIDPNMDDAIHNRDVVERALQLRQQGRSGQSRQQSQDESGNESRSQGNRSTPSSSQDIKPSSSQNPQAAPQPQQQSSQLTDAPSDNQDQDNAASSQIDDDVTEASSDKTGDLSKESPTDESHSQEQSKEQMPAQADEGATKEERQAMEQWLRRIPDDPGGLLRRKFLRQYQQRAHATQGRQEW